MFLKMIDKWRRPCFVATTVSFSSLADPINFIPGFKLASALAV